MSVQVLVGNEAPLVVEALVGTLRGVQDFSVVGVGHDAPAVVRAAVRTHTDVAVLGAGGTGRTGLALAEEVRRERPRCGVVVVAPNPTRTLVDAAIRTGVLSVVSTEASVAHLVHTIRGAAVGCLSVQAVAPPRPAERDPESAPRRCPLSDRERDVLSLTWSGASVKEIARELCLAAGTVRNNTSNALQKMDARNRFDAARIAQERGWL